MAKTTTSRLCVFLVVNALLCSVFRVDAGTCMTNDVYFSYIYLTLDVIQSKVIKVRKKSCKIGRNHNTSK